MKTFEDINLIKFSLQAWIFCLITYVIEINTDYKRIYIGITLLLLLLLSRLRK